MTELVKYERAIVALREAHDVDEVRAIRDQSEAARAYARQAKDTQLETYAAEIKLRAEKRTGEFLRNMAADGTRATQKDNLSRGDKQSLRNNTTLKDLKISNKQSSRYQKLADIPDDVFEKHIAEQRTKSVPVSSHQIRERLTRPAKHAERDAARVWPTGQYGLVYVDPPWQYEHSKTANRAIENHYPTMTLDDIKALDVQSILAPDSVVYLWATSPKLGEAFELLQAWGLTYRSSMVWVKDTIGMGYWARQRHELLLIAVNGSPHPPSPDRRIDSVIDAPRGEHSAKPPEFRQFIEQMYDGPYLELFGRAEHPGWTVWGDQVSLRSESSRRMRVCSRASA